MSVRGPLLAACAAVVAAGCYSPSIGDCTIACGAGGSCPGGLTCGADGLCHVGATTSCPVAGGGFDARPGGSPDARGGGFCGDGVVTPPETCDLAIAPGQPGACPTACDDQLACTADILTGAGTCAAACAYAAITTFIDGDGCCPRDGAAWQDSDCPPVCGNGRVEPGETCDDGNRRDGDGCSSTCQIEAVVAAGFRIDRLVLQDPHVFPQLFGLCLGDQTAALNLLLLDRLDGDTSPADGLLDLSPVLVFTPLETQPGRVVPSDLVFAACTAPAESSTCDGTNALRSGAAARNRAGGSCVDVAHILATTTAAYGRDDIDEPSAPCFVTDAEDLVLDLSGTRLTLHGGRIAGKLVDGGIADGLLSGFIGQDEADATAIELPALGSPVTLGSLLAGDPLCCETDANQDHLIDHDDRDVGPDGHTIGWWLYFNFTAVAVPYTE